MWGHNNYAQMGINNTTTPQKLPVQPFAFGGTTGEMQGVKQIAMGVDHTVFLRNDGTVWTVGRQYAGELGNTTVAVASANKSNVTLQVMAPGTTAGQYLGVNTPVIESIAASGYTSGAVDSNGTAYMWGRGATGILGQNSTGNQTRPAVVKGSGGSGTLTNVKKLDISSTSSTGSTIALTTSGAVYTWGYNNNGQLGDGTATQRLSPVQPLNYTGGTAIFSNAVDVSMSSTYQGGYSSAVLTSDGKIWTWGYNNAGQLATGDKVNKNVPIEIDSDYLEETNKIINIEMGNTYNIALNLKWNNGFNVYSKSTPSMSFTYESNNINVAAVNSSGVVTGVKTGDASIKVTEINSGYVIYVPVYVRQNGAVAVPQIEAGTDFTAVLKSNGTVWTWGANPNGVLGNGTTTASLTPTQVLDNVTKISVDEYGPFMLALKQDGTVWAWGNNASYGELGQGNTTASSIPLQVKGGEQGTEFLNNVIDIEAGYQAGIAITKDGAVYGWGRNDYGELGDGTGSHRNTPIRMLGVETKNMTKAAGRKC